MFGMVKIQSCHKSFQRILYRPTKIQWGQTFKGRLQNRQHGKRGWNNKSSRDPNRANDRVIKFRRYQSTKMGFQRSELVGRIRIIQDHAGVRNYHPWTDLGPNKGRLTAENSEIRPRVEVNKMPIIVNFQAGRTQRHLYELW